MLHYHLVKTDLAVTLSGHTSHTVIRPLLKLTGATTSAARTENIMWGLYSLPWQDPLLRSPLGMQWPKRSVLFLPLSPKSKK